MFQECVKSISRKLKGVSKKFQVNFNGVSSHFQGGDKRVSRKFQLSKFQGGFKSIARLAVCFKEVNKVS